MKELTPRRPARARAGRVGLMGVAAGGVALLGLVGLQAGVDVALAAVLAGLVGAFICLDRWSELRTLAEIGTVPVGRLATPASVVPATMTADAVLRLLAGAPATHHHLVATSDGWQVVASGVLLDHALADRGPIEVHHLGRRARHVAPTTPVDRLPRPPAEGELWVVHDGRPPTVLTRELLDRSEAPVVEADPVARAIADRVTASAATTATAGDRQGEDTTTPAPATPTKVDLTAPDQVPTDPPVPA